MTLQGWAAGIAISLPSRASRSFGEGRAPEVSSSIDKMELTAGRLAQRLAGKARSNLKEFLLGRVRSKTEAKIILAVGQEKAD